MTTHEVAPHGPLTQAQAQAETLTRTHTRTRALRLVLAAAIGVAVAVAAAYVLWFMGLDRFWAATGVLAVVPVIAVLASLGFEDEDAPWHTATRDTPRGSRITVVIIEESLAACERLARPPALRRMLAMLLPERDDRVARANVVRRMRTLLLPTLHERKLDPAREADHKDIIALLGADALTILQPNERRPVTSAAIVRCLDAVERLGTNTSGSS